MIYDPNGNPLFDDNGYTTPYTNLNNTINYDNSNPFSHINNIKKYTDSYIDSVLGPDELTNSFENFFKDFDDNFEKRHINFNKECDYHWNEFVNYNRIPNSYYSPNNNLIIQENNNQNNFNQFINTIIALCNNYKKY